MSIQGKQASLFEESSPAGVWQRDAARRALDDLFSLARQYKTSKAYFGLLKFIARFRFYSPFNAMLIYTQMEGARFVAPPHRWLRDYKRRIKTGARPLVILQPMGPVMFVFDVADTESEGDAPPLPPEVEKPFEVRHGSVGRELYSTIENAKRDGISIIEKDAGSQSAGSIRIAQPGKHLKVLSKSKPKPEYVMVPVRYEMLLNRNYSSEAKYATLVHELAHLYCGHLGTPNDKWWPDRRGLTQEVCEFEAESVSYLLCARLGISSPSDEYLSGYLKENEETPSLSLDCVLKASGLIEQMGRERMKPRKEEE
jgi:hypothetical protein